MDKSYEYLQINNPIDSFYKHILYCYLFLFECKFVSITIFLPIRIVGIIIMYRLYKINCYIKIKSLKDQCLLLIIY